MVNPCASGCRVRLPLVTQGSNGVASCSLWFLTRCVSTVHVDLTSCVSGVSVPAVYDYLCFEGVNYGISAGGSLFSPLSALLTASVSHPL